MYYSEEWTAETGYNLKLRGLELSMKIAKVVPRNENCEQTEFTDPKSSYFTVLAD